MLKRILVCTNFYPPFFIGGAEIIAHHQARLLQKSGYKVAVFCGKHDDSFRHYSLTRETYDGIDVFRVILHTQNYQIGNNFRNSAVDDAFDAVVEEFRPDVIHFHNIVNLSLGIVARAHRHGIRTVLTLHDHWGFCFKNTLLKYQEQVCNDYSKCGECLPELIDSRGRRLHIRMRQDYIAWQLAKVDRFVSPSSYLASSYVKAGIPDQKISVISNGVNVDRFSQITKIPLKKGVRFTFIGYLGFHKGVHILIKAMELLLKRGYLGKVCTVNIVGAGTMTDELANFVKANQIDAAVKLWGKVEHSQIEKVYQHTDVLVTPSIWPENEPVTILEAMAAGIPVLASALGGNLELVTDGVTGCLFEPGNAQMLADKMVEIALNRDRIKSMGHQAYKKVADNTLDKYIRRIVEVYEDKEQTSMTKCNQHKHIILCSGDHVSPECAHVIDQFRQQDGNNRYWFVMSDWIEPEDWENVDLVWIVDNNGKERDLRESMKWGRSLLVPEQNQKLVDICRHSQCGLFYKDEIEAEVCLNYLIDRPSLLATFGQNAKSAGEAGLSNLSYVL
ncbi:glycosyltransferase family 4 protein [Pelatocladus sp. BLCC-F211]|uniref:glycosyltransferase family 4 protein n=1 Tax=Pelatocladus sp. BLCC-F211 TaxID=3342752 RepID=UPI0035B7C326